MIFLKESGKR